MKKQIGDYEIRTILPKDNESIKSIVISTLIEHGAAGEGYASSDPELNEMFQAYASPKTIYFVLLQNNEVVGGAGIGPLVNADYDWSELQKMYLQPIARGKGLGLQLMNVCLKSARKFGYKFCYLETLDNMQVAQSLYTKVGFKQVENRRGGTGHSGCPVFMELEL